MQKLLVANILLAVFYNLTRTILYQVNYFKVNDALIATGTSYVAPVVASVTVT